MYDVAAVVFGPEKERGGNLLALGADFGALFLPFVTGAGLATRGLRAADHLDDAIGGTRWLDDAARACSFTAETLVATPDGPVAISAIHVGDVVLALDESSGLIVERTVTAVIPHPDDEIARLTLDDGSVITTPDHPFFTTEAGWVEAGLLWPGAHVKTSSGSAIVLSVATEPYSGTLWDLTVEDAHTFFVGDAGWLVHNCAAARATRANSPIWQGLDPFRGAIRRSGSGRDTRYLLLGQHSWGDRGIRQVWQPHRCDGRRHRCLRQAPCAWTYDRHIVMDIVRNVRDGQLSESEAAEIFEKTIAAIHRGEADPDWRETFELTNHEASAVMMGASFGDLVSLRYEGWPEGCARCGLPLDYLNYGWTAFRKPDGMLAISHVTCPSQHVLP